MVEKKPAQLRVGQQRAASISMLLPVVQRRVSQGLHGEFVRMPSNPHLSSGN
jgi:hypothetical protein